MNDVRTAQAPLVQFDFFEAPIKEGWRNAFSYGLTKHPVRDFMVDAAFCDEAVRSFNYMKDEYGYYPPIVVEHDFEIDFDKIAHLPDLVIEGEAVSASRIMDAVLDRQGRISKGTIWGIIEDVEHVHGVGLNVKPSYRPAAKLLEKLGLLLYVSPSFFPEWEDPHNNVILYNVLREFTHCGIPHQKNLATPAKDLYALNNSGFIGATEPVNLKVNDMEETLEKIMEMLAGLTEAVDSMGADYAEDKEGDMMDGEEDATMMDSEDVDSAVGNSELAQEVYKLRAQLKEKDAVPAVVERLECSAELAAKIAPVAVGNKELYAAICEIVDQAKQSVDNAEVERPMRGHADSVENSATDMTSVVVSLAEEAAASGVARADAAKWIVNSAQTKGYSAAQVYEAIAPELITPAYSITRH